MLYYYTSPFSDPPNEQQSQLRLGDGIGRGRPGITTTAWSSSSLSTLHRVSSLLVPNNLGTPTLEQMYELYMDGYFSSPNFTSDGYSIHGVRDINMQHSAPTQSRYTNPCLQSLCCQVFCATSTFYIHFGSPELLSSLSEG